MARIGRWTPPLVLMAVIFALSAQPDLNSGLGTIDLVGRKLVHATEYGLLFLLWLQALDRVPAVRYRRLGPQLFAALIAIAYAATDEVHQTFVHRRHGTPVDVLIDAAGVAIAVTVVRQVQHRRRRAALPAIG
ncbi:MAG: VanZ family protein [Solirubrobacterales bacterium]|nr:VanZ family protein [Solirubrobacterales bacterium]